MVQKKHCILFTLFLIFSFNSVYSAQELKPSPWGDWAEAQGFYKSHEFDRALEVFKSHPREGDSTYFYNLGTTYYHLNQPGLALAYLEKANRLSPHDPDTQYNLNQARLLLEKRIAQNQLDPASSVLEQLADRISLDEARATLGLLTLLVTLVWMRTYLKTRNLKSTIFQPSGYIGISALILCLSIYAIQRWAQSTPPAMILEQQVLRSGPGSQFMELGNVTPGVKVRLLHQTAIEEGSQTLWHQIRFSGNSVGWIKSSALLTL